MRVRKGIFMVANNPNNEKNSTKWSNPLNKVICGMKKFMKKEAEEEKKPSSFSTSTSGMNQELKRGSESPTISKIVTPEAKKTKRSEKIKKDTDKEKKLPKKYRKGW
jgi:ferritin